ncbi:hypothetical protein CCS92_17780 [Methylobacterium radiotolerans]|nr:hypothetical protein CCS92_17780 [Methylobacterium radiotolerans]
MPIRPEDRYFCPVDWAQLSAVIRFGRARDCCEGCGRPRRRMVYRLGDGRGGRGCRPVAPWRSVSSAASWLAVPSRWPTAARAVSV